MSVNFTNNPYKNFLVKPGALNSFSVPENKPASMNAGPTVVPAVTVGDVKEEEKNSRKKIFGIIGVSVGSVLLLGIIGLSALSKGFSGGIARKLSKISNQAKKKIYDLSAESKHLSVSQKAKLHFNKGVQNAADAMQASSNISAIKDSFASHWIKKLHAEPVVEKLNKFFKNIVLRTKNNAYNKAELSTIDFCNYLEYIAKKENNPALAKQAKQIMADYAANFSTPNHYRRSAQAWEKMSGLDDKVYDTLFAKEGGMFKNVKKLRSYVTTDLIAKDRNVVKTKLNNAKAQITNSLTDVQNGLKQTLNDIKINVNPNNKEAVSLIEKLTQNIEAGKALNGKTEVQARKALFEKIQTNIDDLLKIAKEDIKGPQSLKITEQKLAKLQELISPQSYKKGFAQEAVTEIKKLYGKDSNEYKLVKNYEYLMNKNINNAIYQELNSYEKLAELRVGSAPTDILGILGPSALAAIMVASSKDKDERISKTLTAGIPILGGIGMSYYGTVRGFTGAKNLILGLTTGYLLNVIGGKTDELVKKYRVEQSKLKKAFESLAKLQKTQKME